MTKQAQRTTKPAILVSWTLIWFGVIFAANPQPLLSQLGLFLWGAGVLIQMSIGLRWLLGRTSSGPPPPVEREVRVPARV